MDTTIRRNLTILLVTLALLVGLAPAAYATAIYNSTATVDLDLSSPNGDIQVINATSTLTTIENFATGAGSTRNLLLSSNSTTLTATASVSGNTGVPPATAGTSGTVLLSFDILNLEIIPITVDIHLLGTGSRTATVDDLATEFATTDFSWILTVDGLLRASATSHGQTGSSDTTTGSATQDISPSFEIDGGETLSVSLFVAASGSATARAAVPTPAAFTLFALGLAGLGLRRWARRAR